MAAWKIPIFNSEYIDSFRVRFPASHVTLPEGTPPETNMEPENHPIEQENHLNQTSIFGFHVLVGAQPTPSCSFARHLVGKMVIYCSFAPF